MSIICQIKEGCNPARDIVEGRRKLVPVVTVPVQAFAVPRATVAVNFVPALPVFPAVVPVKEKRRKASPFNAFLDAYLMNHANEFTVADLEAFAAEVGWGGNVTSSVYNHAVNGNFVVVGKQKSAHSKHQVTVYRSIGQYAEATV